MNRFEGQEQFDIKEELAVIAIILAEIADKLAEHENNVSKLERIIDDKTGDGQIVL